MGGVGCWGDERERTVDVGLSASPSTVGRGSPRGESEPHRDGINRPCMNVLMASPRSGATIELSYLYHDCQGARQRERVDAFLAADFLVAFAGAFLAGAFLAADFALGALSGDRPLHSAWRLSSIAD